MTPDLIDVTRIDGRSHPMSEFTGKTLLVVNVASRCGFTPQYTGLEALQRRWQDRGLVVLGFPCDQFGHQEPGDEAQIQSFCSLTYDVSFPMFRKIEVNGDGTHALFAWLKQAAPGLLGSEGIKWNFTKFLVSADRRKVKRYAPATPPQALEADLEAFLPKG